MIIILLLLRTVQHSVSISGEECTEWMWANKQDPELNYLKEISVFTAADSDFGGSNFRLQI